MFSFSHQLGECPEKHGYGPCSWSNFMTTVPRPPSPAASVYTTLFRCDFKGIERFGNERRCLFHHFNSRFNSGRIFAEARIAYCRFVISRVIILPKRPWHNCWVKPSFPPRVAAAPDVKCFEFKWALISDCIFFLFSLGCCITTEELCIDIRAPRRSIFDEGFEDFSSERVSPRSSVRAFILSNALWTVCFGSAAKRSST